MRFRRVSAVLACAAVLALAACGSDDDNDNDAIGASTKEPAATTPTTAPNAGGTADADQINLQMSDFPAGTWVSQPYQPQAGSEKIPERIRACAGISRPYTG